MRTKNTRELISPEEARRRAFLERPIISAADTADVVRIMDAYSDLFEPRTVQERTTLKKRAADLVVKYRHLGPS